MLVPAITNGDVILIIVLAAIPITAIAFIVGASNALRQIGKGDLAVEFDSDLPENMRDTDAEAASAEAREEEIRQLLEAKAYRQEARGQAPIDVDQELDRLLTEEQAPAAAPGEDAELREEVRQLVVARNERRMRKGEEPLDVDAEVERQLRELENLGQ